MKKNAWVLAALTAVSIATPARAVGQQDAPLPELEAGIRTVVLSFKEALRAGDSLAVLELLHPDASVYEGGHAETRDQYRSGHLRSDIAFLGAVDTETTWDGIVAGSDVAVYMSEYTVQGEYRGREIDAHGTETIALVLTEDGWRIRHIHWSSR